MRLFTIGDSMIAMNPSNKGPLKFNHTFQRTIGGAELNVAIGASRLGLETTFIQKLVKMNLVNILSIIYVEKVLIQIISNKYQEKHVRLF